MPYVTEDNLTGPGSAYFARPAFLMDKVDSVKRPPGVRSSRLYSADVSWSIQAADPESSPPTTGQQAKKPNIVMLMTDDTGWNDFGCYSGGGAALRHPTPNIDRGVQGTQLIVETKQFDINSGNQINHHVDQLPQTSLAVT